MLRLSQIAARLDDQEPEFFDDPFYIIPFPTATEAALRRRRAAKKPSGQRQERSRLVPQGKEDGAASIDLRLGTWFLTARQTRVPVMEVTEPTSLEQRLSRAVEQLGLRSATRKKLSEIIIPKIRDTQLANEVHVRFGDDFILHPRSFVLGVTLEWIRFPSDLGGYVTGRSSWGRRGLVIATATGVHPGFTGCLTLELANLGNVPIAIRPGMTIGQIFVHDVHAAERTIAVDSSSFVCNRRPRLGHPQPDEIAKLLAKGLS
jgi:dCTP deaminase